jgi:hypothetical protein
MLQFGRTAAGTSGETLKFLKNEARKRGLVFGQGELANMSGQASFLKRLFQEAKTPQDVEALKMAVPGEVYATLVAGFSEKNQAATAPAAAFIADASASDMNKMISDYKGTLMFRERTTAIERKFIKEEQSRLSREFRMLEEDAKAEAEKARARGDLSFLESDEATTENFMMQRIRRDIAIKRDQARMAGDTQAYDKLSAMYNQLPAERTYDQVGFTGYRDDVVNSAVENYSRAQTIVINNYGQQGGTVINQDGRTNQRKSPGSMEVGQGSSNTQAGGKK